ncbi:MAG: DUF4249 domain-containing protein [Bacteroidales bacterium]
MRINSIKYYSILGFISLAMLVTSCSDEINVSLPSSEPKIVFYGSITTDTVAHKIVITQTSDYFSNQPTQTISGATLTITDGTDTFPLTESSTEPGTYYTQPNVYGELGKTYTLNAANVAIVGETEAKTYTASCTIPDLPADYQETFLDSINVLYNDNWEGWYVNGWAHEPADQKNFYMFKVYINDVLYSDSLNNIGLADDKMINGNSTNGAALYFIEDEDTLKPGYKVTLELCAISEDYYHFMDEIQTSSQPQIPLFSPPPANARTNIDNGAIGYFSAYAIVRSSYIVKQSDIDIKNGLTKKKSGS